MCFTRRAIIGIDARFEFRGTQQAVWFRDGPFSMDPFRFHRVEPWTVAGQGAPDNAHALGTLLDLLIVLADPGPHSLAAVPGRVVPNQQQGREALGRAAGRAPPPAIGREAP